MAINDFLLFVFYFIFVQVRRLFRRYDIKKSWFVYSKSQQQNQRKVESFKDQLQHKGQRLFKVGSQGRDSTRENAPPLPRYDVKVIDNEKEVINKNEKKVDDKESGGFKNKQTRTTAMQLRSSVEKANTNPKQAIDTDDDAGRIKDNHISSETKANMPKGKLNNRILTLSTQAFVATVNKTVTGEPDEVGDGMKSDRKEYKGNVKAESPEKVKMGNSDKINHGHTSLNRESKTYKDYIAMKDTFNQDQHAREDSERADHKNKTESAKSDHKKETPPSKQSEVKTDMKDSGKEQINASHDRVETLKEVEAISDTQEKVKPSTSTHIVSSAETPRKVSTPTPLTASSKTRRTSSTTLPTTIRTSSNKPSVQTSLLKQTNRSQTTSKSTNKQDLDENNGSDEEISSTDKPYTTQSGDTKTRKPPNEAKDNLLFSDISTSTAESLHFGKDKSTQKPTQPLGSNTQDETTGMKSGQSVSKECPVAR